MFEKKKKTEKVALDFTSDKLNIKFVASLKLWVVGGSSGMQFEISEEHYYENRGTQQEIQFGGKVSQTEDSHLMKGSYPGAV